MPSLGHRIAALLLLAVAGSRGLSAQVVISEVMYHPPAARPEYLVLRNLATTPADIAGWRVSEGVHFEFPSFSTNDPAASFLKAREWVVLSAQSPELTRRMCGLGTNVRVFGPWTGKLSNEGERVTVRDKNGLPVGSVKYGSSGRWPAGADGTGRSLVLVDPDGRVDDADNWSVSQTADARPGSLPSPLGRSLPARGEAAAASVILSEIMFDPPAGWPGCEYVELFNRGPAEVNLSGWRLVEGIQFKFPEGRVLPAGGYLVVAQDAEKLRLVYGELPVIGDFTGRLASGGETLRLEDAHGNLVNEVSYRAGGQWPELTHGGGSSLELMNLRMDNRLASAWAASTVPEASPMRRYSFRDVYRELDPAGEPSDFRELHLYLTGRGQVVLEHVELLVGGTNCLAPATNIATNGAAADGWLAQGTHAGSFLSNGQLHLVADGRGDGRVNHVELDAPGLRPGVTCELRFNARWISGSPRLIAETWDRSVSHSVLLDVPPRLGTPGRTNSRALPEPAPQVEALRHRPAVPRSTDKVRVTARVAAAAPLREVLLFHRPDRQAGGAPWQSVPMFDDGSQGGDVAAGDGVFTAELAGGRTHGTVVQFFVRAATSNGLVNSLPRSAADAPALFVVDDQAPTGELRTVRVVVAAGDLDALKDGNTPRHGFRFPRLSNHYFNATVVTGEDVFYGAEVRQSGSPITRDGGVQKLKLKLPDDHSFRGRTKFSYDDDAAEGKAYHNRVTRYLLHLLGAPVSENEFVRLVVNAGPPVLREEVEPIDNEFLDRNFPRGRHGELYRIDDDWRLADSGEGLNRDANWSPREPDNPASYRHSWAKRTRETEDDFSHLIQLLKGLSSTNTAAESLDEILDARATLKVAAVRGLIGDWDTFTMQRGKNGLLYRRPDDGRFQLLHWDSDEGFITDQPFYGETVKAWVEQPRNERLFYGYLLELVKLTAQEPALLAAWLAAERQATGGAVGQATYLKFFKAREPEVWAALQGRHLVPFEVELPLAAPGASNAPPIRLNGRAPFGVVAIAVQGHPEAEIRWLKDLRWTAAVRPQPGEEPLVVRGLNDAGATLHERLVPWRRKLD